MGVAGNPFDLRSALSAADAIVACILIRTSFASNRWIQKPPLGILTHPTQDRERAVHIPTGLAAWLFGTWLNRAIAPKFAIICHSDAEGR
jgi:hypothetical protein